MNTCDEEVNGARCGASPYIVFSVSHPGGEGDAPYTLCKRHFDMRRESLSWYWDDAVNLAEWGEPAEVVDVETPPQCSECPETAVMEVLLNYGTSAYDFCAKHGSARLNYRDCEPVLYYRKVGTAPIPPMVQTPWGSESETMVADERTGGTKGAKTAQIGAIDPAALYALAQVAGMGTEKYDTYNYLKGYDWSLSYNALQRHAMKFWGGEDLDPESGLSHALHCAWHALALASFQTRGIGNDDRFKGEGPNA